MLSYKAWSYEGQSLRDIKFEILEKFNNILTCMEDPPTVTARVMTFKLLMRILTTHRYLL